MGTILVSGLALGMCMALVLELLERQHEKENYLYR